jgi:beta-glucosidase
MKTSPRFLAALLLAVIAAIPSCMPTPPSSAPWTAAPQPSPPAPSPSSARYEHPYQNPDLPEEQRVANILSLMTLQEKIAFLTQSPALPRLGIPKMGWIEGLHGVGLGAPGNWGRMGGGNTRTTTFPQSIGLGETWDTQILQKAGGVEGYEARFLVQSSNYHRGGLVIRAPNADLGRDPRWGRTEECYGEDPFFNGNMAAAYVRGLQGDNPRYWLSAALLKHFFANSNEDGRTRTSSDFDEALFEEYYGMPFRIAIQEGGARCFMASYNAWNKVPCTVQPAINDVAIKLWGLDGIVSTDAGSLPNLVRQHRFFTNEVIAAAACVKAGINQFLDGSYRADLQSALTSNLVTEADIDRVLKGEMRVYFRLGVLDPPDRVPYAKVGAAGEPDPWTTDKHKAVAKLATQESIVLLKNSGALLPLDKSKIKTIALIGPRVNEVDFDWYSAEPPYFVTPLQGVKAKVGPDVTVNVATNNDDGRAVQLAKSADVAIVCVGNNPGGAWAKVAGPSEGRESVDRKAINLEQEELIQQVFAANPKTVVVLISSYPYAINWTQDNVPAIVHMAQSSQELGSALADVLFGDYNPAGRLVETWPKSLDQLPAMMDYNIRDGRTYMYFKGAPLYPFGYGLSYTTFEYSNLKTSADTLGSKDTLKVSVDVRNSGKVAGEEVVQLYVQPPGDGGPAEELRGFQRVALKPGERKTVEMTLPATSLMRWDLGRHAFVLQPGRFQLLAGASSADIRLKKSITTRN